MKTKALQEKIKLFRHTVLPINSCYCFIETLAKLKLIRHYTSVLTNAKLAWRHLEQP